MSKEYQILPFFYYEGKEKIIQNENGIIVVKNSILNDLLKSWDINNKTRTTYDELKSKFGKDTQDLVDFLSKNGILKIVSQPRVNINKIYVLSTDKTIAKDLVFMLRDYYNNKTNNIISISLSQLPTLDLMENDALIVSLTQYSMSKAEVIREKAIQSNCLLLFGHYYSNSYYIDNLYKYEWHLPCHLCNLGNIQTRLKTLNKSSLNYQELIEQLYKFDNNILISTKLYLYQKKNITLHLFNRFKRFLGDEFLSDISPENLSVTEVMNLKEGTWSEDFTTYWELCDCYER